MILSEWIEIRKIIPLRALIVHRSYRGNESGIVSNASTIISMAGILNAADYGVPQRRKRAIVLAGRTGLLPLPTPTHCNPKKSPTLFQNGLLPWETVTRAIEDLPEPVGTKLRIGEIPPPLDLHFGRTPTKQSLSRYRCVPEGGNRFDLQKKRPDLTPMCWIRKKSGGTDLLGRL